MPRLLVRNFSISLDGYAAGPHQDLDNPLGVGGMQLHDWLFATRSGNRTSAEKAVAALMARNPAAAKSIFKIAPKTIKANL